jgi:hypothetical protein
MKTLNLTVVVAILSLIHPVQIVAAQGNEPNWQVSQSVNIRTDANGEQVQFSRVSLYRVDLSQPHILRIQAEMNNSPMPMEQVVVKLNGKVVKSIANRSFELNLAPLMIIGRNEVEVSGTASQSDTTISLNFKGPRTQVNQQSSGSGRIKQMLVINVL